MLDYNFIRNTNNNNIRSNSSYSSNNDLDSSALDNIITYIEEELEGIITINFIVDAY